MKKAWPWAIGLLFAVTWFTVFETKAFTDPADYDSLSHVVSTIGAKWPLAIFICGQFCGVLSAHFFWAWRDNPMGKGGG